MNTDVSLSYLNESQSSGRYLLKLLGFCNSLLGSVTVMLDCSFQQEGIEKLRRDTYYLESKLLSHPL